MIAADANALVYAVLPGEFTASATAWLASDDDVVAPPLVIDEVRNVLLNHVRRGALTMDEAIGLVATVRGLVRLVAPPSDQEILRTAWDRRLTAYDATHVATAMALRVRLITADKVILGRCPDVAVDVRRQPDSVAV